MARLNDRTGKQEEVPRYVEVPRTENAARVEALIDHAKEVWSGKLSKPKVAEASSVQGPRIQPEDDLAKRYPALAAFVSDVTYDDGSRRSPGSFVVFVQDGLFTVCLTDKTTQPNRVAFQAARTLSDAFSLADMGLRSGELPWRLPKGTRQGR